MKSFTEKKEAVDEILKKTDIFSLGTVLFYLSRILLYSEMEQHRESILRLGNLFYKMVNPNYKQRPSATEASHEYQQIIYLMATENTVATE